MKNIEHQFFGEYIYKPCDVGDTVYYIGKVWNGKQNVFDVIQGKVVRWEFNSDEKFNTYSIKLNTHIQEVKTKDFNKIWFVDKQKAEENLEEVKNG